MNRPISVYSKFSGLFSRIDYLPALALRCFLAPVFIMAGWKKLNAIEATAAWFGNDQWGLGLPFPELLTWLVALTEFFGGIALIVGLGVRVVALILFVTMVVAGYTAHWANGWQMIADPSWFGINDRVVESAEKLARAKAILREHGNYRWLTSSGSLVILNNGIETAASYAVMCLGLVKLGAGRFLSIDYWLCRAPKKRLD